MYACILETGRGFFGGVCTPSNTTAYLRDPPPPPLDSRIDCERRALAIPMVRFYARLLKRPSEKPLQCTLVC
jgi:hypothetical protein